eukprot:Plantae.Rhodophyta-Palmaria_palmata.ctg5633.p1 GENE.Plantae.Rhodophyta-Palmaria_palmata.ctg5633~~Plantae.Rhodophyta-Palmaria_palmata.ctg5633.p1  ORF type:complete len:196 (-),score=33.01 Plantae.Rhodophyta-Palmaria_palmata.ctg5633:237-824(-)
MYGLYEPDGGRVLIDGQDIWSCDMESVQRAIGVVPQDTVLFNESVRYNIAYGRLDATDREVEEAARDASLHSTITKFAEGYDTNVGELGKKISGGEKQRLAIARTLLKNPSVLLLDEISSHLDSETEADILASLRRVSSSRTALFIAHRLSTISDVDNIIVLEGGRIAEEGSHSVLTQAGGRYADMWHRQQQGGG